MKIIVNGRQQFVDPVLVSVGKGKKQKTERHVSYGQLVSLASGFPLETLDDTVTHYDVVRQLCAGSSKKKVSAGETIAVTDSDRFLVSPAAAVTQSNKGGAP